MTPHHRRTFRLCVAIVIAGLVLSGVTAFPLLAEVELLGRWLGLPAGDAAPAFGPGWWGGFRSWIFELRGGLRVTYERYPWVGYGTDWLAFGHLVIALFFIDPLLHPEKDHRATLLAGIAACVGVIPLALIAGEARGIPLGWRLIDCAFGVVGVVPLLIAWRVSAGGSGAPQR